MKNRILSAVLILIMLITSLVVLPVASDESRVYATLDTHKYHLDIGAQHIWGNGDTVDSAVWQNGYNKSEYITVTTSLTFPNPVVVHDAYVYNGTNFRWEDENYSFNKNSYLKSKTDFEDYYIDFCSNNIKNIKATAAGKVVTLSYDVLLKSELDFDLKFNLNYGRFDFIMEILGGENNLKKHDPETYEKLAAGKNGQLSDDLYGYMYFCPIILEYETVTPCELCGECGVVGADICTSDSCEVFGTNDCGCSEVDGVFIGICERCGICELDPESGEAICTETSCNEYGTERCGCSNICKDCGFCHIDKSISDHCTSSSCSAYNTINCGCYEYNALPTGSCDDVISWTESSGHSHSVKVRRGHYSSCYDEEGKRTCNKTHYTWTTCNHTISYEADLSVSATLIPAKPFESQSRGPAFKSGYGFAINANASIDWDIIRDSGSRSECTGSGYNKTPKREIAVPTSAEVRTTWTVKHREQPISQPRIIPLELSSNTTNTSSFRCRVNPISEYNERLIFTDVALKGTTAKPVKHDITVYVYGGGVGEKEFCQTKTLSFWINGNMYEDDFTVDRN